MKLAWWLAALSAAAPAMAQDIYGGPAVMSRPPMGVMSPSSDLLVIRPSLYLMGNYESGLYLPATDLYGRQLGGQSIGGTAMVGLNGYHRFRHSIVGLNYRGSFRHYTRNNYLDGTDHIVSLSAQHQLSPRTMLSVSGMGGTYSRGYGVIGGTLGSLNYGDYSQGADPTAEFISGTDLIDARTYYAAAGGDVVHQKSARLSLRFGGSAFAVRRRSKGLIELNGASGRTDVTYRLGRRTNIGVDYEYVDFRFVRSFGSSIAHTLAGNLAYQIDRNWTIAMRFGGYRVESLRLESVEVDPVVAAIIGQSTGLEASYRINYGTALGLSLARNFRRAGLRFSYNRGIMPGNAIFLTSRSDQVTADYDYRGWRRWSLGVGAVVNRSATVFQDNFTYTVWTAHVTASYRLARSLHVVWNAADRYYDIAHIQYAQRRNSYLFSVGFGFTPSEMPLSLW